MTKVFTTALFGSLLLTPFASASAQTAGTYQVTNIISDGSVPATTTDANFLNPWGVSEGPAFWINTPNSGFDYVATAAGKINFKVIIPTASGSTSPAGTPSGTVFSAPAKGNFLLPDGQKATFMFSSLDGIITGWNAGLGMNNAVTQVVINNSANKASYTDMALLNNDNGTYILAANFGQGSSIEAYDGNFAPAKLQGTFSDPNLPAGYAPFSVHALDGHVFVTYALRSATTGQQVVGAGNGILDVYDDQGNFVSRAVTGGNLNAPWGVAVAPSSFGVFGGDILVGNFGDGLINVYDPNSYAYLGQLIDGMGNPLSYPTLWEITFGAGGTAANLVGDPNTLYFAAGLANQAHGLFGAITSSATPSGNSAFGFSASTSTASVAAGSSTQATVSVTPTNNFAGTVSLSCTAPSGVTCTFAPSQLNVVATASSTSQVTIKTTASMAALQYPASSGRNGLLIVTAMLLPLGLLRFRKRFGSMGAVYIPVLALLSIGLTAVIMTGCSSGSSSMSGSPGTPAGMQQVTLTATSGTTTKTTTLSLNVQ